MDEDLEDIKKEKLEELKAKKEQQKAQEQQKEQLEKQKKQLLRKILTSEARSRLANLRMARPDFTERIELQLIQIAKTGRIDLPIGDDQLQKILKKLEGDKKSINIRRK